MAKPRLLLDVDGPLTNSFVERVCLYLRDQGIARAKPEDITDWDIMKSFDVPSEIAERVYFRISNEASLFEPREGAKEFLAETRKRWEVIAVTSSMPSRSWAYDREMWLMDHLDFTRKEIVSTQDKSFIRGNVFVDDKFQHIVDWSGVNPFRMAAILWDAPCNEKNYWPSRASSYVGLQCVLDDLWA